jgi:hypothetical protein
MRVRILTGLLIIVGISFFGGCVSSQYLVRMEYTNPNSNTIEYADIPVSQYEYEQIKVGDSYSVTIKPTVMGIKRVINSHTSQSGMAMAEILPSILLAIGLLAFIWNMFKEHENIKGWLCSLIMPIIMIGTAVLFMSGIHAEFVATGHIIDKTFQIVSR